MRPASRHLAEDQPCAPIVVVSDAPRDQPGPRVAAGLIALACGHLAVDCCTGIWPVYKTLAHLDLHRAGAIATAAGVISNGLQMGFGFLGDRGHSRALLAGGILITGAVTFVPFASDYSLLFALVLATAIGSAAFHPIGAGAAGALSRRRTGVLMALFLAGGYLGYALSQWVFTAAYRAAPNATALLSVFPALASLVIWRLMPETPRRPSHSLAAWASSMRGARRPLACFFAVQALSAAVNQSLVFLLPDLMLQRGAATWVAQGGGHFALVAGGALALLPAGHAADQFGGRRVLLATNLVSGLTLAVILAASWPPHLLLPLLATFGAFSSANNVVAIAEGNRLLPGLHSGVSALLMGLPWCLASVGPVIAGTIADPRRGGTPSAALGALAVCIPVALCAAALLPGRARK